MQNFRFFPAVVALAIFSLPFLTRADDTPAQAAARAALEQQMNQPDTSQTNSMTAPAMTPGTETVTNAYAPAPAASVPPMAPMPVTPAPQMMVSPQLAVPEPATNAMTVPVTTQQYPVNPPMTSTAPTNLPPITVPPMETPPPVVANPPSASTNLMMTPPVMPPAPPTPSGETQLAPPPVPITAEKQAQLQELLSRYMADQITPGQYQAERAKILAQP